MRLVKVFRTCKICVSNVCIFYKRLPVRLMNRGILIMVSIKDIAAVCGVSIATVSKALNDHKDVSETTKRTVQETAKKMGYFPNSQARALKTNRTYNIGVLFTEQTNSGLTQNYFASVLDSFKKEAESEGYDITFISGNIGERKMTPYEHCMYRNVDGVVVVSVDDYVDKSTLDELLQAMFPLSASTMCLRITFRWFPTMKRE